MQAYLSRSVCAMDMVDGALNTLGLTFWKYDKSFDEHYSGLLQFDRPSRSFYKKMTLAGFVS